MTMWRGFEADNDYSYRRVAEGENPVLLHQTRSSRKLMGGSFTDDLTPKPAKEVQESRGLGPGHTPVALSVVEPPHPKGGNVC